jgi:hypothetical protein
MINFDQECDKGRKMLFYLSIKQTLSKMGNMQFNLEKELKKNVSRWLFKVIPSYMINK